MSWSRALSRSRSSRRRRLLSCRRFSVSTLRISSACCAAVCRFTCKQTALITAYRITPLETCSSDEKLANWTTGETVVNLNIPWLRLEFSIPCTLQINRILRFYSFMGTVDWIHKNTMACASMNNAVTDGRLCSQCRHLTNWIKHHLRFWCIQSIICKLTLTKSVCVVFKIFQ